MSVPACPARQLAAFPTVGHRDTSQGDTAWVVMSCVRASTKHYVRSSLV